MLNIRISHCTDGVEKVIEISDKDVATAFSSALESTTSRAQRAELSRFVDNGDGTITDTTTGLMWSKDDVGSGELKHADAEKACKNLSLAGHKDWRLPTHAELLTLVDDTRYNPAIDTTAFPSCKSGWYWSGTPYAGNSSCAWIVDFSYGLAYYGDRNGTAFVRAVRAPAGQ
jgi:hypothetical protein